MTWLGLSLKEWQRRPLRTAITAAGTAIAVAALFSLLAFQRGYQGGLRKELDELGAHILLVPKGCPYDAASMALHGAAWPCYLKEAYLQEVLGVSAVGAAAPLFMSALYDQAGNQAVYVGADENILALKPAWQIRGKFPSAPGELLAGSEQARRAGWQVGEQVSIPGFTNQTAAVAGILAPTQAAEDTFIYLRLSDAQRLFKHTNALTHILVRLSDPDQLDTAVRQLRGCDAGLSMNVVPLTHVFRTIQTVLNSTRLWLGCVALVALLIAGAGVTNSVLMAVNERLRDIGVMRAIGASRQDILRLIWIETLEICLAGAVAGIILAMLLARSVETWARSQLPFAPVDRLIHWDPAAAGICLVLSLLLGLFAAFLPAWRAAAVPPSTAIRSAKGQA